MIYSDNNHNSTNTTKKKDVKNKFIKILFFIGKQFLQRIKTNNNKTQNQKNKKQMIKSLNKTINILKKSIKFNYKKKKKMNNLVMTEIKILSKYIFI